MNLEKFKSMPLKNKIMWIVQYYGIAIIVGIIAIVVLFSFIDSVFFPDPIPDTNIIILSNSFDRDDIPKIEEEIALETEGTVSITAYSLSEVYGNGAFSIKLTADQIDLVICPEEEKNQMLESGYLESVEELDYEDLYLGVPIKARKGDKLDIAIEHFRKGF